MPTISVIVPVNNVEKYIHCCIDSILNQTYRDFELILVDDGSPDNCSSICDEYAAKDDRIVVIHQENGGLSAARNAGIDWAFANSDSEWLTFIDSDDLIHEEYLRSLYNAALEYDTQLSQCGSQDFHHEEEICTSEVIRFSAATPSDVFLYTNSIVSVQKLIHKSLMHNIRFPIGKLHEDQHTTWRVIFAANKIAVTDAKLYYYRLRENSIMHSPYSLKRQDVLEAFEGQLDFFKSKRLWDVYYLVANNYLHNIVWQYKECQKIDFPDKHKTLRALHRKTVHILLRSGKKVNISLKKNPDVFEVAFPGFMYLYWGVLAQISKLKKLIR